MFSEQFFALADPWIENPGQNWLWEGLNINPGLSGLIVRYLSGLIPLLDLSFSQDFGICLARGGKEVGFIYFVIY